ncbi:hypothetical protein [Amphritea pacifica]|uniref:Uncharacterized protein n=1 Tax=Amphritea pacifica TaxID=2811233 RepID=A0ABS2W366_9GAMM|nr:hypothetical protein [Amphritea pacifica]MBN0986025.1 hypothetical protein [Amphritea pacifica]
MSVVAVIITIIAEMLVTDIESQITAVDCDPAMDSDPAISRTAEGQTKQSQREHQYG